MQLTSLVSHVCEVLSSILKTFPEGGSVSTVPPDALIASYFRARKYLGSHDRRFIAETTYGTIRHLRRIDRLIERSASSNGTDNFPSGTLRRVLTYLLLLDEIRTRERSDQLAAAYSREAAGLPSTPEPQEAVNTGPEGAITELADRFSLQPWMVREFVAGHGQVEAEQLCRSLNEQAPLAIRTNTLKTDRDNLQTNLQASGIETRLTQYSPLGLTLTKRVNVFTLEAFRQGFFEVQDEGSQLLPLFIDPKPTVKVLDACAGAGGKTLELSALMNNRGEVVATDISRRRLVELRRRARRAGAHNIRVREADYTSATLEDAQRYFDVVLLDAPCSGTGTLRRNPGLKWTVSEDSVRELVHKQSSLLAVSASLVKPGGVLWYCTCSLLRSENEGVVERFLSAESSFTFLDPTPILGRVGVPDAMWGSTIHLLPHRHGTDGFFCAALQRMT